jgi:hypothetical protein
MGHVGSEIIEPNADGLSRPKDVFHLLDLLGTLGHVVLIDAYGILANLVILR